MEVHILQWKSAMEDDVPMKLNYMSLMGFRKKSEDTHDAYTCMCHWLVKDKLCNVSI